MNRSFLILTLLILLSACKTPSDPDLVKTDVQVIKIADPSSKSKFKQPEERQYSLMEREIEYLIASWPGQYDNVEQPSYERDIKRSKAPTAQIMRSHSTVTKLTSTENAEYLLLFESYRDNDRDNIYIASIGHLTPLSAEGKIKIAMYPLDMDQYKSAPDRVGYAQTQIAHSLKSVTPNTFLMRRNGDTYLAKGNINGNEVKIRLIGDQMWVSPPSDAPLEDEWLMMEKARCFTCMIDFPKEKGGFPGTTAHYIDIHDQGGDFQFEYTDGRTMMLSMRNTWSYGMQRETFVIALQENDLNGKTLTYSWGNPGADRIGMNPMWIRIQCDLKTDDNVKFQHLLRPDS